MTELYKKHVYDMQIYSRILLCFNKNVISIQIEAGRIDRDRVVRPISNRVNVSYVIVYI